MADATLTKKDFQTDQEVRWCPGCGDYAILSATQQAFAELGLERHNTVVVSGIGCAAWIPSPHFDFDTLHTLHGRAVAFATGAKPTKPLARSLLAVSDDDGKTFRFIANLPVVAGLAAGGILVAPFAARLGLDDVIATRYGVEDDDDTYDGTLVGPFVWSLGKLGAVRAWADEHDVDLAESYAYSDSVYDTPMLAAAYAADLQLDRAIATAGVLAQHLAEGGQFIGAVGHAGRVRRAVDHEQPGILGQRAAQLRRRDLEVLIGLGVMSYVGARQAASSLARARSLDMIVTVRQALRQSEDDHQATLEELIESMEEQGLRFVAVAAFFASGT